MVRTRLHLEAKPFPLSVHAPRSDPPLLCRPRAGVPAARADLLRRPLRTGPLAAGRRPPAPGPPAGVPAPVRGPPDLPPRVGQPALHAPVGPLRVRPAAARWRLPRHDPSGDDGPGRPAPASGVRTATAHLSPSPPTTRKDERAGTRRCPPFV